MRTWGNRLPAAVFIGLPAVTSAKNKCSQADQRKADPSLESKLDEIQLTVLERESLFLAQAGWILILIAPLTAVEQEWARQCCTQLRREAAHSLPGALLTGYKPGGMTGPGQWLWAELHPAASWSLVGFPKAQHWGQFCLIPLLLTWPNGMCSEGVGRHFQAGQERWSAGGHEGSAQGELMGWGHLYKIQQGQVSSPTLGSWQPHAWGLGKSSWKTARWNRAWRCWLTEHEPAEYLGGQEDQWHPGLFSEIEA